jgi:UDP-N-acetylmuramyl pentapeptide phosphotransferase/UDP-N-acetylglucosamine-1-phosphate transferase
MSNFTKRYSRRTIALFWLCLVAAVIIGLLFFEQIAVLYVLATLALVVLMLIVAFDDLEKVDRDAIDGFNPDKK